jgi:serine/threonine protein phosphatase PrpC
MMEALWTGGQIQGARDYQEDFFGIAEGNKVIYLDKNVAIPSGNLPSHQTLLVVVDGMGGMGNGDLAASIIVENFINSFLENYRCNSIKQRFISAVTDANQAIAEDVAKFPDHEGMGATIVAVLWDSIESKIYWLSIGDSLLFRFSQEGKIETLNEKHTWKDQVDVLRNKGNVITEDDLISHGSALCSAVDGTPLEMLDINEEGLEVFENDIILLGSDGLETLVNIELDQLLNEIQQKFSLEGSTESKGDVLADYLEKFFEKISKKEVTHQDNTTALLMGLTKV